MVLPDLGVLEGALLGLAVALSLLLGVVGVRGVPVVAGRPPGRVDRALATMRSPEFSGWLIAGLVAGVITLLVTRWFVAAAAVAVLVVFWPRMFSGAAAEQRAIDRLEALIIWIEALRDTMAGNVALAQALGSGAGKASPLIRPALERVNGMLARKVPVEQALLTLADDLDDATADYVLAALIAQQGSRGASLRKTLDGVVTTAREDLSMRRRVVASRRQVRKGSTILLTVFGAFMAFFVTFGHAYVAPYNSLAGQGALCLVVALTGAGFYRMRQLAQLRVVPAYLRRRGEPLSDAERALVLAAFGGSTAELRDGNVLTGGGGS